MAAGKAATLYTPEILTLAVELAQYPFAPDGSRQGSARSKNCGSTLDISFDCGPGGTIGKLGMRISACAIGQASAAIFARHAIGRSRTEIGAALSEISLWLDGQGPIPAWPDLELIAPARTYPARHGAILLPWKAAAEALSNA
jgi:NifU-like protein involved in Fe-S cluster formation